MILNSQRSAAIHARHAEQLARGPEPFRQKSIFLVLFAASLVNAAIVLLGLPELRSPLELTYSMGFGDLYDLIAKNLSEGNGYRVEPAMGDTMLREPGYPLLLAIAFKLAGYGIQQARVVCVLLAFAAAFALMRLTRKITGDRMIAVVAGLLFLLYPGILIAEARAGIEIPSIFTATLFMLVLYRAVERGCIWWYWAAGLLVGVAVLVRSAVLLFPLVLLVYFLVAASGWAERRKVIQRMGALALGAVLAMSPWITRNYLVVHEFVPTATVAGVAAQEGLYSCEHASSAEPFDVRQTMAGFERKEIATRLKKPFIGPYYQLFYTPQDELAFNHALLNHVSTEYRTHPALLLKCGAKNVLFNFWFLGKRQHSTLLNIAVQAPLLALAAVGVAILRKRGLSTKAAIVVLYILYIPAVHAPIIAHARHSMLIVPFLAILAATSLVSFWRTLRVQDSGDYFRQTVAATPAE